MLSNEEFNDLLEGWLEDDRAKASEFFNLFWGYPSGSLTQKQLAICKTRPLDNPSNPQAQVLLAMLAAKKYDDSLAESLLNPLVQQQHYWAQIFRGWLVQNGRIEKTPAELAALLDEQIRKGNTYAMISRAKMHQDGSAGPVNLPAAIGLLDCAVNEGNVQAMVIRARLHRRGIGGPEDLPAAIELLERAISAGNIEAMEDRARMYLRGQGDENQHSEHDRKTQALALFRRAQNRNAVKVLEKQLSGLPEIAITPPLTTEAPTRPLSVSRFLEKLNQGPMRRKVFELPSSSPLRNFSFHAAERFEDVKPTEEGPSGSLTPCLSLQRQEC